jgi:hypothetical protein
MQFIPHPSKWLHGDGWNDPPCPPRNDGPITPKPNAATERNNESKAIIASLRQWEANGYNPTLALRAGQ